MNRKTRGPWWIADTSWSQLAVFGMPILLATIGTAILATAIGMGCLDPRCDRAVGRAIPINLAVQVVSFLVAALGQSFTRSRPGTQVSLQRWALGLSVMGFVGALLVASSGT